MLDRVLPIVKQVLLSYHDFSKKLKQCKQITFAFAVSDIKRQITQLMPKGFLGFVSVEQLKHYPRYIKAMITRLDKLQGNVQRDKLQQIKLEKWQADYETLVGQLPASIECFAEVLTLNWMMQEYRVSLFAQELGTAMPVSDKRWKAQLDLAKQSILQ